MTEYVSETYEEIREKLQVATWEIMDEEQRDAVMQNVIVPRWGKTTADGVVLKSTAWAQMLGTTEDTIRGRYRRLTARSEGTDERSRRSDELTEHDKTTLRHARRAVRTPKLRDELLDALPDEHKAKLVREAVAENPDLILDDHEMHTAVTKRSAQRQEDREHAEHERQKRDAPNLVKAASYNEVVGLLFQTGRTYAKALDAVQALDLDEEEKAGLREAIDNRISVVHDWFLSFLASDARGFDDQLAQLLDEGR